MYSVFAQGIGRNHESHWLLTLVIEAQGCTVNCQLGSEKAMVGARAIPQCEGHDSPSLRIDIEHIVIGDAEVDLPRC